MALDKLKFWKKQEDDFGSDPLSSGADNLGLPDSGVPSSDSDPFSHPDFNQQQSQEYPPASPFPGQQSYSQPQQSEAHEEVSQKDVELILAKLDMIKSELDSLHQRIRKIEQSTETQQQQKRYW